MSCEVFIPFPGFYESWLSVELDDIVEDNLEEYPERSWEDYSYDFQKAAREYVEVYWATVQERFKEEGSSFHLADVEFKELISPREYNFTTDRVLVEYQGDPEDLLALRAVLCGIDSLAQDIKDRFESRSGFASFYDDFVTGYQDKPVEGWDANELSVLLPDYGWDDLLENLRESLYDCVIYKGEEDATAPDD